MMATGKQKLTLDRPVPYEIKVPGELDVSWAEWAGSVRAKVEYNEYGSPITTLTGTYDQAALLGLLRRFYSLGIPLISVRLMEAE